jgi:ABC-2 type transport system permease protein
MFWHIFKYRIKCITRDKQMMFWTLLFPIVLATFFNMAFSNLNSMDLFSSVKLAIVDNDAYKNDKNMQAFIESMSTSVTQTGTDENAPLTVSVVSAEKAVQLLNDGEVSGYLDMEGKAHLYFKSTGINQTILRSIFDHYLQTSSMAVTIITSNPASAQKGLLEEIGKQTSFFQKETDSPVSPDMTVIYFYTVLAMACFYGGFMGMKEVEAVQADLSPQAARINLAPTHKFKVFISAISAASLIQLMTILILLAYIAFVIKIDFGNQVGYLLLLCVSGCVMGVSFGAMICALVKGGEGIKTGILIGTSMTLSFFAGMMYVQVKYLITSAVPAMAYLNPLNVITDAFYALYYYPTHTRYFINLGVLWLFTLVFAAVTVTRLRRLKYASI